MPPWLSSCRCQVVTSDQVVTRYGPGSDGSDQVVTNKLHAEAFAARLSRQTLSSKSSIIYISPSKPCKQYRSRSSLRENDVFFPMKMMCFFYHPSGKLMELFPTKTHVPCGSWPGCHSFHHLAGGPKLSAEMGSSSRNIGEIMGNTWKYDEIWGTGLHYPICGGIQ